MKRKSLARGYRIEVVKRGGGGGVWLETYSLGSMHVTSPTAAGFTDVDARMAKTSKCSLSTV
jgi:hypothetical protein